MTDEDDERADLAKLMNAEPFDEDGKAIPPAPMIQESGERSWHLNFREGGTVRLQGRDNYSAQTLFVLSAAGSLELGGQALRCSGFRQGMTLRVNHCHLPEPPIRAGDYIQRLWHRVQPTFEQWVDEMHWSPSLTLEAGECFSATVARDELEQLKPGVAQIEVAD